MYRLPSVSRIFNQGKRSKLFIFGSIFEEAESFISKNWLKSKTNPTCQVKLLQILHAGKLMQNLICFGNKVNDKKNHFALKLSMFMAFIIVLPNFTIT